MELVQYIDVNLLEDHPRNENLFQISPERYEYLRDQIALKRQYKPLVVTPKEDGSGRYTILAGHKRRRAITDLSIPVAACTVVEIFLSSDDGLWHTRVAGELTAERFQSREAAELDWMASDNEDFGHTNADELANIMPEFPELNLGKRALHLTETPTVDKLLSGLGLDENGDPQDNGEEGSTGSGGAEHLVECPNCHEKFDAKRHKAEEELISDSL